jgi:hypothetical protein
MNFLQSPFGPLDSARFTLVIYNVEQLKIALISRELTEVFDGQLISFCGKAFGQVSGRGDMVKPAIR